MPVIKKTPGSYTSAFPTLRYSVHVFNLDILAVDIGIMIL